MKLFKNIAFVLLALAGTQLGFAQSAPKLTAIVQMGTGKPAQIELQRGDGKGSFFFMKKGTEDLMQAQASRCAMFLIMTPADMAKALRDYYGGDYAEARADFAKLRKKYAEFSGLPGSPGTLAPYYELVCAVRMGDVAGAKKLAEDIPGARALNVSEAARVDAARVFAMIDDTPESYKAITEARAKVLKDRGRNVDSEAYGWMQYAVARAAAATIPAAKDKAKSANAAVDYYCQAAMSMHGSQKVLPADAILRAMNLLWEMPGVQDYAATAAKPMDKKAWAKAPCNFCDAVALAHYYKALYADPAAPNALADQLDAYFCNTLKGVKKEK